MTAVLEKKRIQNKAVLERIAALGGELDKNKMSFKVLLTLRDYSCKY